MPDFQPPTTAPLVGRERELATLRAALDAALAGRGALVLIGGEAGIGKTALAEALCAAATTQGATVLVGRCYDLSETPPYGPWAEALASAPREPALPPPPDLTGGGFASQAALLTSVRDHLAALVTPRPLVLLLDDLHWADPASLDLLRVVARGLAAVALLLLATYRAEEIADDHPLAALLPLLVREARAARLDLRPLDQDAIAALVASRYTLDAGEQARLVGYLAARTEGNALFVGELLRTLEGEGVLRPLPLGAGGDRWVLGDLADTPVPALLRHLIAGRLARLSAETQRLLTIAAIVGREVPLTLWAEVGDVAEERLFDHIERASAAHLLAETPDGAGVRFPHALIREAIYAGMSPARRRAWHRRVAEALLATPTPEPEALAYHFRQAGDPRARPWLVAAGHRALRAFANRTAAQRYAAALALAPDGAADPGGRGWLLVHLAAARYLDDSRGTIGYLEEAVRLAAMAGDRALAGYARFRLGYHLTGVADYRRGLPALTAGVAELEALDPAERALLPGLEPQGGHYVGTFSFRLAQVGRFADARRWAEDARVRADECDANLALADVHAAAGQVAAARAAAARGCAAKRREGELLALGIHLWYELHSKVMVFATDQLDERRHLAEAAAAALARGSGLRGEEDPRLGHLPLLAIAGHWDKALAIAGSVVAGRRNYRPVAAGLLAHLAHAQGDDATGIALTREALPLGPAEEPGYAYYYPALELQRLAAARAIAAGDLPVARSWLAAHDRWLAWSGTVPGRAEGQLGWAAYHRAAGDLVAARAHAERALAHASEPRQPLALLAAHRTLGVLDTSDGRISDAVGHLAAALALAEACAAPYERALTLLALAELRAGGAERAAAHDALDTARGILVPLGAAPALARADALEARLLAPPPPDPVALPFGLTAREAEVLALVAEGLTNAEVAARLFVTPRTVNGHLTAIYTKLNVTTRTAAARVAAAHGLR